MLWIPPGALLAGTPVGLLPRVASEEMDGVEVRLGGFFVDAYNHPGEPGAIPLTNVSYERAQELCEQQDKRLCTELEWERACKGPENTTYEYGNDYDPAVCATGGSASVAPNAVNNRCESAFGVRDMHGSAWNWTSSPWGRGTSGGLYAVRGGNGLEGELIGRCANGRGYAASKTDSRIGVRCSAGARNDAEVDLSVVHGVELHWRKPDAETARALARLAPIEIHDAVRGKGAALAYRVGRLWVWRPIGNEELLVGGGCAKPFPRDMCGVVVARHTTDGMEKLAFVSSEWWQPTIGKHDQDRAIYLYGGDRNGAYRKSIVYEWGRIGEGVKYRKKRGGWLGPLR